jgi:hypothetical protein
MALLACARSRKNPTAGATGRLPPGPPALLFLTRFLALWCSIFDLAPLLCNLHTHHGHIILLCLARMLVFVADCHLVHRLLVQGGNTFVNCTPPIDSSNLFTAGGSNVDTSPYGANWCLVRCNLTGEALQPAHIALFATARRWACDDLVNNLPRHRQSASSGAEDDAAVTLRPFLRRDMFELLVYMCFGRRVARLGCTRRD